MKIVYAVFLDDYDSSWPNGIFDNLKEAIEYADELEKDPGLYPYEVVQFRLNEKYEFGLVDQVVYRTREYRN